jgi:hypothetical protein
MYQPPVRPGVGEASTTMIRGMTDYLDQQLQEALGSVNKWYCSQYYGYEVTSPELLLAYYIKHGGASHFHQAHCLEVLDPSAVTAGLPRS